jgi:hypothetical protein
MRIIVATLFMVISMLASCRTPFSSSVNDSSNSGSSVTYYADDPARTMIIDSNNDVIFRSAENLNDTPALVISTTTGKKIGNLATFDVTFKLGDSKTVTVKYSESADGNGKPILHAEQCAPDRKFCVQMKKM